jgi:transcriptional regulator with XRE-family HTH domain
MTKRVSNATAEFVERHVGERVRLRRQALDMSERDLDTAIGEPMGTVAKFERGAKVVGAQQLFRLSRVLGVSPSYFFEEMTREPSGIESMAPGGEVVDEAERFLHTFFSISELGLRRGFYDLVKSVAEGGTLDPDDPAVHDAGGVVAPLQAALAGTGLIFRDGFHPRGKDGVPGDAGTVLMIGNAGPAMWRTFSSQRRDEVDPMDAWTRWVLTRVGRKLGADVYFPFDGPPYLPFQQWAQRADSVYPSPIGPFIHPEFGLWHAYRGALVFTERLDLPVVERRPNPCDTCADVPCQTTCPVGAIGGEGYDVPACVDFLDSPSGAECMDRACLARHACPVGHDFRYLPAQARFHMEKFLAVRRPVAGT